MPRFLPFAFACAFAILAAGCPSRRLPHVALRFEREGAAPRTLSLAKLAERVSPEVVSTDDPYYRTRKRFRALRLDSVLAFAFGRSVDTLRREHFLLRASDGYTVPIEGTRLLEGGAYLAFDDVDVPGFAPIGPRRVPPGPFYMVWTREGQGDAETHPRPWQLVTIALARFEDVYPHVVPAGEPADGPAMAGFRLFRARCVRCHAINGEGGHVGPDLNVPRSIVEYRPEEQIRAFVRDPSAFRYGAMPAHPDLTDGDLDALLAYFRAMARRKHDPRAAAGH
ncbi:MAG: cytochrome c [Polyangiales bacterium]